MVKDKSVNASEPSVAVLMATYNGAAFLRAQLDSLMMQTYPNWKLYVRDDGSSDGTVAIIREYAARYPDRIVFLEDGLHLGAGRGFMYLMEHVDADYYSFCDQDDVWLPMKLEVGLRAITALERKHPGKPVMVSSDLVVVDKDLRVIHESFYAASEVLIGLRSKFEFAPVGNQLPGCTMIINRTARELALPMHPDVDLHDTWVWLMCAKHGAVKVLPFPTLLYRQHGNNTVGFWRPENGKYSSGGLFQKLTECYRRREKQLKAIGYGGICKAAFYKAIYLACVLMHRIGRRLRGVSSPA